MQGTEKRENFVERLIDGCARNPFLTLVFVALAALWGVYSMRNAPLDATPDLSDVQVIIFTEWPGRSPDLVEKQLTYPISSALLSAPNVSVVRGQSMFGMSFVYAIFEDGTDIYWARSRVLEYMQTVRDKLPEGVNPTLGPDASAVGWVFQYALVDKTGKHDLQELRSIQDWNIRYALQSVPGVAEVAPVGGYVKQYQIVVDPQKLASYGITISEVIEAVRKSNGDVGGRSIEMAGHEYVVRGRGYVETIGDLGTIPLRAKNGVPVYLRDVAHIAIGPDQRRGFAELDGNGEVVGGIVVARFGENALRVIDAVKERLEEVKQGLPEGVEVVVTYDRSGLIRESMATVTKSMIEEMIVVSLVLFIFLMHARSSLVAIITLPLGVVLAFIPMYYQGITANIMSLGGIIVAIGAMVDASMIIIENIHKKLEEAEEGDDRTELVIAAMKEVGPSIFYSLLVIMVAFIPIFTLTGSEGRLFKPLAYTKTYSMGFGAILAITLTPALAVLLIRGRIQKDEENRLNRWLVGIYTPVVRFVVDHPKSVISVAVLMMLFTIPAYLRLGNEFMPPLNEGAVLYMPTAPPGMSMTEAIEVMQVTDRKLKEIPEVVSVFGKMGRANTPTDPAPIGMAETTIVLKPKSEWRPGMTWELLIKEMDEKVQIPGMPNIWWMPIQTRTEMLSTGVRSPLGIQVFADDLETIEKTAIEIEKAVAQVSGTRSAFAERSVGGFFVDIETDREAAARYGLSVADINEIVSSGIGGESISETVEGRERYPISVRFPAEYRERPEAIEALLISTPSGAQVPLGQVAKVRPTLGPPMVRSEDGALVGFVFVDTDRPIADYVEDAKAVVARDVKLPPGVRINWTGQYKYFERAKKQLMIVVPVTLTIVLLLLYFNTKSVVETGIVLLAVPFSLIGAIWLLYLLGYNMSVAVWVGLIALAGVDAETGVVMLLYLTLSHKKWKEDGKLRTFGDLREAIVDGAAKRIRPKLMTVLTDMIGLLPVLWATGTGADLMKRIAAPLVGGLATSFLLELTVYPAIFALWKKRELKSEPETDGAFGPVNEATA
ncbi:MAG: CusA/CzcA family heavy metal efflux RND transporter [Thermoanaerobaculia bacterium]|nr:CusA/CzcA family heavy metal efflux RND transporter [Thermoanaerobaculia bacterium]